MVQSVFAVLSESVQSASHARHAVSSFERWQKIVSDIMTNASSGDAHADAFIALFVVIIASCLLLLVVMRGRGARDVGSESRHGGGYDDVNLKIRELKTLVDSLLAERRGQFDYIKQDLSIVHQKLDEHSEHLRLLVQPIADLAVTTQFRSPRLHDHRG